MEEKRGILYGVGVGPGDAELLTLKAVRILKESDVIALPDAFSESRTAWSVVRDFLGDKPTLSCPAPMVRDRAKLDAVWEANADAVCALLDEGKQVAFITLGDPSIYSTCWYLHRKVRARGYEARLIPGVPSFCAAAAGLNTALCEGKEPLLILPASCERLEEGLDFPGNKVIMKAGRQMDTLKETLCQRGELERAAIAVNCGLPGERYCEALGDVETEAGYFAVVVVK